MAIYTKKGDTGETSLFDSNLSKGKRISKDSLRIQAVGSLDELNSYLGVCKAHTKNRHVGTQIKYVQKNLLTISSILAGSKLRFTKVHTKKLEELIDQMDKSLPKLTNFIVLGGSKSATHIQHARTVARRAERVVVSLNKEEKIKPQILAYLNRLSDYLFVLARKMDFDKGKKETVWKPT